MVYEVPSKPATKRKSEHRIPGIFQSALNAADIGYSYLVVQASHNVWIDQWLPYVSQTRNDKEYLCVVFLSSSKLWNANDYGLFCDPRAFSKSGCRNTT
eukprot:m.402118 g.402118  ORF g.402118 m.402118 type:complete len:99 (-) comp21171_c0_seq7:1664-1960(-)